MSSTSSPSNLEGGAKFSLDVTESQNVPQGRRLPSDHVFHPDPGTKHLFRVRDNKFAFTPGHLSKLFNPKNLTAFYCLGGLAGIEKGLRTDRSCGLSNDEATIDGHVSFKDATGFSSNSISESTGSLSSKSSSRNSTSAAGRNATDQFVDRSRTFGYNRLPPKSRRSLWKMALDCWNDEVLILLTIAALVSLSLGLYEALDKNSWCLSGGDTGTDWVEGVATLVAVKIIVIIGTLNEWQKAKQFLELNRKKDDRNVKVMRSGRYMEISVFDLMVGDVALLEPGDVVPADGIFIGGHNVRCDESSITGESDFLKKHPGILVFDALQNGDDHQKLDPFILSGSKVTEGHGTFLVTAVGRQSTFGKTVMAMRDEGFESTPLQRKLSRLARKIATLGGTAGMVLLIILLIKFGLRHAKHSKEQKRTGQCYIKTDFDISGFQEPSQDQVKHEVLEAVNHMAAEMADSTSWRAATSSRPKDWLQETEKQKKQDKKEAECKKLRKDCKKLHSTQMAHEVVALFLVSIGLLACAIPEGLPLAVTLALAFAMTKMVKDNNLVRVMQACETMGNSTTVCSDKTGTLTENKMTLVAGTIGRCTRFNQELNDDAKTDGVCEARHSDGDAQHTREASRSALRQASTEPSGEAESSMADFLAKINPEVKTLLKQSLVINSTAFESVIEGRVTFVGSKTETSLLEFARQHLGSGPVHVERSNSHVLQMVPFGSAQKYMATIVKLPDGKYRAHVKGATEVLLEKSSKILRDATSGLVADPLDAKALEWAQETVSTYASSSLRTLGLAYRDFEEWPPIGAEDDDDRTQADFPAVFQDLTFMGTVGIKDPLRGSVKEAVADCKRAGVTVRMVTGDNMLTAQSIAKECGIFTPQTGGIAMEGPEFRKLTDEQMKEVVPHLQVLARSSPEDKQLLVRKLKALGETVSVTGDGTNDAPALKSADVGFSMGVTGTEVAKEASDIILMDDNFSSIVKAIMWGRAVNDAVKKFIQFQLTVNITAVALTTVTSIYHPREQSVLNAVQLLWLNLIMDTFAALALATDPPSRQLLKRKPDKKSDPLVTLRMWKLVIGEAVYQFLAIMGLYFFLKSGYATKYYVSREISKIIRSQAVQQFKEQSMKLANDILVPGGQLVRSILLLKETTLKEESAVRVPISLSKTGGEFVIKVFPRKVLMQAQRRFEKKSNTLIFNSFVWMQIFNESNNRRLDNGLNIFKGISKNWYFIGITILIVFGQVAIMTWGGKAFGIERLGIMEWIISICLGLVTFPVAIVVRKIPDRLAARLLPFRRWRERLAPEYYPPRKVSTEWEASEATGCGSKSRRWWESYNSNLERKISEMEEKIERLKVVRVSESD